MSTENVTHLPGRQEPDWSTVEARVRAVAEELSPDHAHYLLNGGVSHAIDPLVGDARALAGVLSHLGEETSAVGGTASLDAVSHVAWIIERLLRAAEAADRFERDLRNARVKAAGIEPGPNPAPSLDYIDRAEMAMWEVGCDEEAIACVQYAAGDLRAINAKQVELYRLLQRYLPDAGPGQAHPVDPEVVLPDLGDLSAQDLITSRRSPAGRSAGSAWRALCA